MELYYSYFSILSQLLTLSEFFLLTLFPFFLWFPFHSPSYVRTCVIYIKYVMWFCVCVFNLYELDYIKHFALFPTFLMKPSVLWSVHIILSTSGSWFLTTVYIMYSMSSLFINQNIGFTRTPLFPSQDYFARNIVFIFYRVNQSLNYDLMIQL